MHGDVVAQLLKFLGARHEIRLAIHFDQHADLSARMDVGAHQAIGGLALAPFSCAAACPFLRRNSTAFSMSPLDSTSAWRQSLKPAPVARAASSPMCAGACACLWIRIHVRAHGCENNLSISGLGLEQMRYRRISRRRCGPQQTSAHELRCEKAPDTYCAFSGSSTGV